MKKILIGLLLIGKLSFGASGVVLTPSDTGTLLSQNFASLPLTNAFTGANAQFGASLLSKSNICLVNGSTVTVIGSLNNTTCDGSTVANFIVLPNNGTTCLDRVRVKSTICLKSETGGLSTTGWMYGTPW